MQVTCMTHMHVTTGHMPGHRTQGMCTAQGAPVQHMQVIDRTVPSPWLPLSHFNSNMSVASGTRWCHQHEHQQYLGL